MTTYNIYIESNEHPRTINTPMMGRTNYTRFSVHGKSELCSKISELREAGKHITEVCTDLGNWIDVRKMLTK